MGNIMSATKKKNVWFGMKVTPEEKRKIKQLAEARGVSQKEAVLQSIDQALSKEEIKSKKGSFYDLTKDVCGIYDGPRDLSTNPKYMEGFGK